MVFESRVLVFFWKFIRDIGFFVLSFFSGVVFFLCNLEDYRFSVEGVKRGEEGQGDEDSGDYVF